MSTEHYNFVKILADGTEIRWDIVQWANETLTTEELATFDAAQARQNALIEVAIANGEISIAPDVTPDGVPTGGVVVTTKGTPIADSEWLGFWDRFISSPDIIRK